MLRGPHQAGVAVVDERRIGELGSEPILDGHQHSVELVDPVQQRLDSGEPVADDHAAAVRVVDAGATGDVVGATEDADDEVRGPLGAWNRSLLMDDCSSRQHLVDRWCDVACPHERDHLRRQRGWQLLADDGEYCGKLRVVRRTRELAGCCGIRHRDLHWPWDTPACLHHLHGGPADRSARPPVVPDIGRAVRTWR